MRKKQPPRIPPRTSDTAGVTSASQYIGMSTTRNGEATLRWMRAGLFTTLHIAIMGTIPFVFEFSGIPRILQIYTLGVISIVGIPLGIAGNLVNERAHEWIEFWNESLRKLEVGPPPSPVSIFRSERFWEIHDEYWSFHKILQLIALLFIAIWSFAIIISFTLILLFIGGT